MSTKPFKVYSDFKPAGDQPTAIDRIVKNFEAGSKRLTLMGVTGSGKTFTMAKVIERLQKPTLIITHNKTLSAQLYSEFRNFFPENSVNYFVSYYDYYQPEAYVVSRDLYIEKDSSINDEIDKLRLAAAAALLERRDVIIVASVSCIYGLGNPRDFKRFRIIFEKGKSFDRNKIFHKLVEMQYSRNQVSFERGTFRVRGDTLDIYPAYIDYGIRIQTDFDEINRILKFELLTGNIIEELDSIILYPAKHFMTDRNTLNNAIESIKEELAERLQYYREHNKPLEAERIESRTNYDIEMMQELGYCTGIENYSRILSGRKAGERPATLIDYFDEDFLTIIDESHKTLPQIRGMYRGDRSRKESLVKYGFRLPSALDNRPLVFNEFEEILDKTLFVSATPNDYEIQISDDVIEQIIRPTGLIDPEIIVQPADTQIDDLKQRIIERIEKNERVLITTLTKKMAEDITGYYSQQGLRVRYLHSEIETIERVEIIRDLRAGKFDILIGINLLREGLDMPEVSLVAILDADKEGFLRSTTSLIQTIGRAARNLHGTVVMYADEITKSMSLAIKETERRRKIQMDFNLKHNITPKSIEKSVFDIIKRVERDEHKGLSDIRVLYEDTEISLQDQLKALEARMLKFASELRFEEAAFIRDQMIEIEKKATKT